MEPDTSPKEPHEGAETSPPHSQSSFYNAVASALHKLQAGYERGDRATLATLRRAAGKSPEKDPLAWSFALDNLLPDFAYQGVKDEVSDAELAAFTALTLYALHQRSISRPMHQSGRKSLGAAAAELTLAARSKSIKSRLDTLMVARTQNAVHYHLRSLVSLLHAHEIPLDYAQLAQDLLSLKNTKKRDGVILRWGRDYALTLWKKSDPSHS